jgi:hypothetical protein
MDIESQLLGLLMPKIYTGLASRLTVFSKGHHPVGIFYSADVHAKQDRQLFDSILGDLCRCGCLQTRAEMRGLLAPSVVAAVWRVTFTCSCAYTPKGQE